MRAWRASPARPLSRSLAGAQRVMLQMRLGRTVARGRPSRPAATPRVPPGKDHCTRARSWQAGWAKRRGRKPAGLACARLARRRRKAGAAVCAAPLPGFLPGSLPGSSPSPSRARSSASWARVRRARSRLAQERMPAAPSAGLPAELLGELPAELSGEVFAGLSAPRPARLASTAKAKRGTPWRWARMRASARAAVWARAPRTPVKRPGVREAPRSSRREGTKSGLSFQTRRRASPLRVGLALKA